MMNNKTNNQQSLYKTNSNFGNISNYMTDSKSKLRPISALSKKEGIKNYPEMINQKSNLKPYINKHTKNSFKYNTQSVQKQKQNKSNTSINIINNINNISTLNLNNNNNNNSQTSLFNKNNHISNNNNYGNNNQLTNSMLMNMNNINPSLNMNPISNNQNNYHSNTNNINIRNSEKTNTNKTTPVSNSLPKFKLTTTTPMSNIMPLNDIEKLYEECINLRNTNNIQSKEIISLKSEIQKKENEIIKNSKYMSKYILNSNDYSGFPNININSPSNTNTNTYTHQNNISVINSIKETQLIHKLKQQYKEAKNEINDKNTQIIELKKTLKYTRIQEIANENNILKEELKKLRLVIKEFESKDKQVDLVNKEKTMLKEINAKLVFELKNKSEEMMKMEEFYNKVICEKELEIKNNINKQVNYGNSNSNSYGNKNSQDVSISSSGFDVCYAGHCNVLVDIISKVYSKHEELTCNNKNNKDKINSNSKSNKKKLRDDDNNNDTKSLINKLNEITGKSKLSNKIKDLEKELSDLNNKIKLNKSSTKNNNNNDNNNKLKLTELSVKEKEAILAKQSKPRKGKKLKKMYYTSKTETYNINYIDNILFNFEEETNKASIAKSNNNHSNNSNHSKNQKKQKSLSEEEVNEYTYILIKNLEVLCLGPEQLEEILFDYDITIPNGLNNLYNRTLSLLCLNNRSEKDKLQSYLLTLSSLCNGDFVEVKEKLMIFFEAINIYSPEQVDLYEEKLSKKLIPYIDLIYKELKQLDTADTKILNFEDLRHLLQNVNIELKETYIEYLIYKMKCSIYEDEERDLKIDYLNYSPLLEILEKASKKRVLTTKNKSTNKKKIKTDIEKQIEKENSSLNKNNENEDSIKSYLDHDSEESSLNEDDLKDGIDNLNIFNLKQSANIDDIQPSKEFIGNDEINGNNDKEGFDYEDDKEIFNAEEMNTINFTNFNNNRHTSQVVSQVTQLSKSNYNTLNNNFKEENSKFNENIDEEEYYEQLKYEESENNNNNHNKEDLDKSISEKVILSHANSNNINKLKKNKSITHNNNNNEEDDLEISISEFNSRNEKLLYKLAEFLLLNKKKVDDLFVAINTESLIKNKDNGLFLIKTEEFFSILENLSISMDTIDQYCLLMKLANERDVENNNDDDDMGNYIDINKLKDEMTNYGVFDDENLESVINLDNKKFSNKFYYDKSSSCVQSNVISGIGNKNNKDIMKIQDERITEESKKSKISQVNSLRNKNVNNDANINNDSDAKNHTNNSNKDRIISKNSINSKVVSSNNQSNYDKFD